MKVNVRKLQNSYFDAEKTWHHYERSQLAMEKEYISSEGIINPDGSIPEAINDIDDDDVFEKACDVIYGETHETFHQAMGNAEKAFKEAGDALITMALSMIPAGEAKAKESLLYAVEHNAVYRQKVIDLSLKLV